MTNKLLPSRSLRCQGCSARFKAGQSYLSFLKTTEKQCIRKDYCLECSKNIETDNKAHIWQGKIPFKEKQKLSPDAKALELLKDHLDQDPGVSALLALYLERRGQLIRRRNNLFEEPESGLVFALSKDSRLSEDIETLKDKVSALFDA